MNKTKSYLSTLSVRAILSDMLGRKNGVAFRFRLLGEMWKPNFMHIVKITDRGAIFTDDHTEEFVFVADLSDIVQFEVDGRMMDYQPNYHYDVSPG